MIEKAAIDQRKLAAKTQQINNEFICFSCEKKMKDEDYAGVAITKWRSCKQCNCWFCGDCCFIGNEDDDFYCNCCVVLKNL